MKIKNEKQSYSEVEESGYQSGKDIERKLEPFAAPGKSDRPAEMDRLNRAHYVNALAALITHKRTEVPLTIGIYG
ncbi:MAG: hypothetical protein V3V47_04915, partial [Desulfobacteria bacterium]